MREYKFRGLDINGRWFHGLLSISQGKSNQPKQGSYISNSAGSPWAYQVRPETVGEYTGLQDKNGKEIFEGDVLRLSDKEYEINFRRDVQVKWSSGGWWYVEVRNDDGMSIDTLFVGYCFDDSEVIGNIYENPDLLEQPQDIEPTESA